MRDFVALVAGASGGVGSSIATELLGGGAEVLLLGRSMENLRAAFPSHNLGSGAFVVADLTDAKAVENVGSLVMARGRLDALILSSGIYERSNAPEAFHRQIAANVLGPYALI